MNVKVSGKIFRVSFKYSNNTTLCYITDADSNENISYGTATLGKKDKFDKHVGRRLSFSRAIKYFSKDIREIFWNTYFFFIKDPHSTLYFRQKNSQR